MSLGLTPRLAQLRDFIASYQAEHNGVSPTYTEIAQRLGLRSRSNVHRLIDCMVARGQAQRIPGKPRSITVSISDPLPPRGGLRQFEEFARRCIRSGVDPEAMQRALWTAAREEAQP